MAVIDKSQVRRTASQGSDAQETSTESRGVVVDVLQDKSLAMGAKRKIDKNEDAWEFAAPPKEGRYNVKLYLAKDPVKMWYDDEKNPNPENINYTISFEGKLTAEEFTGVTIFPGVSTRIARGKNISTAEGLLIKLGYKVPDEVAPLTTAKLVVQAVMKEPTIDVHLRWNGWSKLEERNVWPNMASFPVGQDGEPVHIATYKTKDGRIEEIRAQLRVDHWYGKNEKEESTTQQHGGTGPQLLLTDEPIPATPARGVNAAAGAPKITPVPPASNDASDDLLILEE